MREGRAGARLYKRHALRGRPCLLIEVAAGPVHLAGLERPLVRRAVGERVGAVPRILVGCKLTLAWEGCGVRALTHTPTSLGGGTC